MIEQTIFALVNPLIAGGLHPNIAPQGCARPYAVYTEVVSPAQNTLSDGSPIQNTLFQIAVWDVSYLGAKTAGESISAAISAAFAAGNLAGVQRSRRGIYEADTEMHGFIYEFSFWYH
jgi:hypothetical protein